jgi:succinate dehydrogenase / fumarate reductase, cytochrome b subunit
MSRLTIYTRYHRFMGSWAYLGHRLSGLVLVAYVFAHILSLKGLQDTIPPEGTCCHSWTEFVEAYTRGFFPVLEWMLFAVVLFHAMNGVRVAFVDLGSTSKIHKPMFWVLMGLGTVLFLGMGVMMFGTKLGLLG